MLLAHLLVAAVSCNAMLAQGAGDEPAARRDWLRAHALELKSVNAQSGFDDLQPLKAMIGDARVVGLGEGTHGTREHFQMKHRLLEFLASEMGFSIFSIEANMPESYALDDYVQGGEGDVARLIGGMYFWTWNTEEVREMVEWMRRFNAEKKAADSPQRVHFTGFDMQTGTVALRNAILFLEQHDAQYLAEQRGHLDRLAEFHPRSRSNGFGCATGQFPVDAARGKHVRFRGWIKTQDVENWAGLWWRVDGPTQRFDNMQDRGPRGTSDWQEVSLELDVPEDARAIFFGLVMPGSGTSWFDALEVELDGERWSSADFDLDFELDRPTGFVAADPSGGPPSKGYRAEPDPDVHKSGRRSFRLTKVAEDGGLQEQQAEELARGVLDHMLAARDRYAAASDARAADWAIQNARVVHQWTKLGTDEPGEWRDEAMADNVRWILERDPGAKVVLWAHNWHVRDEAPWMGSHLREALGEEYVNLAFCSSHGEYYAVAADRSANRVHELAAPVEGSFESILESDGRPLLLVDLRSAKSDDPGSSWLTESRPFAGIIGAMEMPAPYRPAKLQGHFDLLIYTRDTSAARQLATKPTAK